MICYESSQQMHLLQREPGSHASSVHVFLKEVKHRVHVLPDRIQGLRVRCVTTRHKAMLLLLLQQPGCCCASLLTSCLRITTWLPPGGFHRCGHNELRHLDRAA